MDSRLFDPEKLMMELHINWGHAFVHQLRRVLVDSDGETAGSAHCVDEVLDQCEVCRAPAKSPHIPIAGTFLAAALAGNLQVDLLFCATRLLCVR